MAARRRVRAKPERVRPSRPRELSDEEKLRRANLPKELSAKYHPFYEGKVEIVPKVPIRGHEDFAIWYTPGVAQPCLDIKADPSKVWQLTNKWNNVAIVTDGTRVLGLGDIGPEAGLPAMEGKSLLFKYLGGGGAHPIPLPPKGPGGGIQFVERATPPFCGGDPEDIASRKDEFREKWELSQVTNSADREGGIPEAMKGTDVVIAASKPGPGVIQKEWVRSMADDAILFVIANPVPEIWPWEAKEAGARVVATGRSDFPNQVNNSLGFPGIFRGTLDVRAKTISDEMCIAAARELAAVAEEKGLNEEYIVPTMEEVEVFAREAAAVALKAMEQGLARVKRTRAELIDHATQIIRRAQRQVGFAMSKGFIKPPPR